MATQEDFTTGFSALLPDRALPREYTPCARAILQIIFDGFGPSSQDTAPVIIPVVLKSCTIHLNGYSQADSWDVTFDGNDLPFDPQLIRAGAIEIYLFQLDERGEPRVLSRQLEGIDAPGRTGVIGTLMRELGMTKGFRGYTQPRIVGLFDEAGIELSDDGKWVTLSGQDYTALLIGKQWPPEKGGRARRIPTGKRIDLIVNDILAMADEGGRLHVEVRGIKEKDLPIVGKKEVRGNKRGIPVEQDTSYWDVIYKLVTRHGLIVFVEGLAVVITRPQTLIGLGGETRRARHFIWGRNISSLHLSRRLGMVKVPTVVLCKYDQRQRKTITVEYPAKGVVFEGGETTKPLGRTPSGIHQATNKQKSGGKPAKASKALPTLKGSEEYQVYDWDGPPDPELMLQAAKAKHAMLGGTERKCVLKTCDLEDADDVSLLDVATGDTVSVDWNDFNRETLASQDEAQRVQHLLDRGYNAAVAELVAKHYTKLDALTRPMYLHEGTIEYDADDGVDIELELVDYVVVDGVRSADQKITHEQKDAARLNRDGKRPDAKERPRLGGAR